MPKVAIAGGEICYEVAGEGHPLWLYPPEYVNAHDAEIEEEQRRALVLEDAPRGIQPDRARFPRRRRLRQCLVWGLAPSSCGTTLVPPRLSSTVTAGW